MHLIIKLFAARCPRSIRGDGAGTGYRDVLYMHYGWSAFVRYI